MYLVLFNVLYLYNKIKQIEIMTTVTNSQKSALVQMQDLLMDNIGCTREEATEKVLSIMRGIANA